VPQLIAVVLFVKLESQYTPTPMAFKVPTLDRVVLVWVADTAMDTMNPDRNASIIIATKTAAIFLVILGRIAWLVAFPLGGSLEACFLNSFFSAKFLHGG
jgi:hypothetical protein